MLEARTNLHLNAVHNSTNGHLVDRMVAPVTAALRYRYVVFCFPMFKKIVKDFSGLIYLLNASHNETAPADIVERTQLEVTVPPL